MSTPNTTAPAVDLPRLVRLPNDVARCYGVGSDEEGWREGCDTCLRRVAQRGDRVAMIAPPPIIAFECEFLIEPNAEHTNAD